MLILLGAIMIGLFGVVPEPSHSLEDLIELWKRPAFIIYFSLIELTIVSLLVGNRIVEGILKRSASTHLEATNSNVIHPPYHQRSYSNRYPRLLGGRSLGKLSPARIKTILGISYGCVGGMLSSQALLFAKSAIDMLYLTIVDGKNQFENPLSWFLVIALVTAALLQVKRLSSLTPPNCSSPHPTPHPTHLLTPLANLPTRPHHVHHACALNKSNERNKCSQTSLLFLIIYSCIT